MTPTPGFCEILIEGADARNFLHSQLASDVRGLAAGRWQHSCYCGADGRVQALAMLGCEHESRFVLLLPAELGEPVLARLQRFRLRARCVLDARPVAICAGRDDPLATRWRSPSMDWSVRASAVPAPLAAELWRGQVELGIPWLLVASSERWLPQMLALDRIGACSLRKGCYPGQEIIARTHYLGRAKRRLVRLRSEAAQALPAGTELLTEAGVMVAALLSCDDAGNALGVASEAAVAGLRVCGSAAHGMSTLLIESDVAGAFGDAALNEYLAPAGGA